MSLPRTHTLLEQQIDAGLQIGAQLAIKVQGQIVANWALGEAKPGVPMSLDTVMLWLSASKPFGAAAIMQLVERNLLQLDDAVCRYIPEFAAGGKDTITIRHLLTHTAGFRGVDTGWPQTTWDEIIARIAAAPLEPGWVPGKSAGYDPYASWYILGELVRRLDGRPYTRYVREALFLPLGMTDCWIGMPPEQIAAYGDRLGRLVITERPDRPLHMWSTDQGIAHTVPGGNGHGPMMQLARFYEMMLAGGTLDGTRVLEPESVAEMIRPQRVGLFDDTFKQTIDWGLGLLLDTKQGNIKTVAYGYGRHASPRAFGHGGSQSSVAFADPDRQLVAAIVLNGMPGERAHQPRMRAILETLYEELFF